jgi:hypothetical protein
MISKGCVKRSLPDVRQSCHLLDGRRNVTKTSVGISGAPDTIQRIQFPNMDQSATTWANLLNTHERHKVHALYRANGQSYATRLVLHLRRLVCHI